MEYVVKILLNAHFGKYGEKWEGKSNTIHESLVDMDFIDKHPDIEKVGNYFRYKENKSPPIHSIPIFACYTTAYGRIKLHKALIEGEALYCDTDSILTTHKFAESNKLGDLKEEMKVSKGFIVRPKFYILSTPDKDYCKIKGISQTLYLDAKGIKDRKSLNIFDFTSILRDPVMSYNKFTMFKEALRRNLIPNELVPIDKKLDLEDKKRVWPSKFDMFELQDSEPVDISTYIPDKDIKKYEKFAYDMENLYIDQHILTDTFDKLAVGHDISDREFIENEMFFAEEE